MEEANGPDVVGQTPFCPTCGRASKLSHSPEWLLTRFKGLFAGVLAHLIMCRRERKACSRNDLCFAAYGGKAKTPTTALHVVTGLLDTNRSLLNELGWDIVGPKVSGLGYYLVPIEHVDR